MQCPTVRHHCDSIRFRCGSRCPSMLWTVMTHCAIRISVRTVREAPTGVATVNTHSIPLINGSRELTAVACGACCMVYATCRVTLGLAGACLRPALSFRFATITAHITSCQPMRLIVLPADATHQYDHATMQCTPHSVQHTKCSMQHACNNCNHSADTQATRILRTAKHAHKTTRWMNVATGTMLTWSRALTVLPSSAGCTDPVATANTVATNQYSLLTHVSGRRLVRLAGISSTACRRTLGNLGTLTHMG